MYIWGVKAVVSRGTIHLKNNKLSKNPFTKFITTKDFLVSGKSFDLLYDAEREMLITSLQPKEEDLASYYESEAYISHTDASKGIVSFLYQQVKKWSLQNKVSLISSLHEGEGALLDVGAGTGEFLKAAQKKGWKVTGVEPNKKAQQIAFRKEVPVFTSLEEITQQFDVITLWHVLEHLPHLEKDLAFLENSLKPGGFLIIAVPNYKSYDAEYYKKYWAAFDVPRHLWHFSRTSLPKIVSSNLQLQKTKPMWFDSFYVSLLSEKYKSGASFSIEALFVGFWSNIKAMRSKEYSSVIYIFRKEK